jgi:hypothetical protein
MPCRDYQSDDWGVSSSAPKLKQQMDMLARIACKAMDALEEDGRADLLLLKDDEVRVWWEQHKEADRKERARVAEKERKDRIKAEALARLSQEEKELLGLASKKKSVMVRDPFEIDDEIDDYDDYFQEHVIDGEQISVRYIK